MKKVAIKLDGTESHFFKSQGYLIFLGGIKPFTQWIKDVEYILIGSMGLIQTTNSEVLPDDFTIIDPFNSPNHTSLNGRQEKTFPREMMVWDFAEDIKIKCTVEGMFKGRYICSFDDGDMDIYRYAKDIESEAPTEHDKLKTENEMLKNNIARLKELFDSII